MNRVFFGCGGHFKVVYAAVKESSGSNPYIWLVDESTKGVGKSCSIDGSTSCVVYGTDILSQLKGEVRLTHAIGNNAARERIQHTYPGFWDPILAPNSYIASDVSIGNGSQVLFLCTILPNVVIGDGTIINNHCNIDHDCRIGSFSHIAPGTTLCGTVTIGSRSFVGAGSVIAPGVSIGDNCFISMGSRVYKDLDDNMALTVTGKIVENTR